MARPQQTLTERTGQLFFLRYVQNNGQTLFDQKGDVLQDKGDTPIDLNNISFLSVDWKNDDKYYPHCFVKSKDMVSGRWRA